MRYRGLAYLTVLRSLCWCLTREEDLGQHGRMKLTRPGRLRTQATRISPLHPTPSLAWSWELFEPQNVERNGSRVFKKNTHPPPCQPETKSQNCYPNMEEAQIVEGEVLSQHYSARLSFGKMSQLCRYLAVDIWGLLTADLGKL